jgi:hypothetical protein
VTSLFPFKNYRVGILELVQSPRTATYKLNRGEVAQKADLHLSQSNLEAKSRGSSPNISPVISSGLEIIPASFLKEETSIYAQSVQPRWLKKSGGASEEIASFGFKAENLDLIPGTKGDYFQGSPYYRILAAIVPPGENLITQQNFTRWQWPGSLAEQDMAIGEMPGIPDDILGTAQYHTSLCGVLTVSTLVGEDPAYFISKTYNHFPWAKTMYSHPGYGTYETQMIEMFDWYGWKVDDPDQIEEEDSCKNSLLRPGENDSVGQGSLCEISRKLDEGYVPVVAANLIVDKKHGVLVSKAYGFSGDANAAHWVAVLQLVPSADGNTYARIFNPLMNREEWYMWNDLFMAWQVGPGLLRSLFYAMPPVEN